MVVPVADEVEVNVRTRREIISYFFNELLLLSTKQMNFDFESTSKVSMFILFTGSRTECNIFVLLSAECISCEANIEPLLTRIILSKLPNLSGKKKTIKIYLLNGKYKQHVYISNIKVWFVLNGYIYIFYCLCL